MGAGCQLISSCSFANYCHILCDSGEITWPSVSSCPGPSPGRMISESGPGPPTKPAAAPLTAVGHMHASHLESQREQPHTICKSETKQAPPPQKRTELPRRYVSKSEYSHIRKAALGFRPPAVDRPSRVRVRVRNGVASSTTNQPAGQPNNVKSPNGSQTASLESADGDAISYVVY